MTSSHSSGSKGELTAAIRDVHARREAERQRRRVDLVETLRHWYATTGHTDVSSYNVWAREKALPGAATVCNRLGVSWSQALERTVGHPGRLALQCQAEIDAARSKFATTQTYRDWGCAGDDLRTYDNWGGWHTDCFAGDGDLGVRIWGVYQITSGAYHANISQEVHESNGNVYWNVVDLNSWSTGYFPRSIVLHISMWRV